MVQQGKARESKGYQGIRWRTDPFAIVIVRGCELRARMVLQISNEITRYVLARPPRSIRYLR